MNINRRMATKSPWLELSPEKNTFNVCMYFETLKISILKIHIPDTLYSYTSYSLPSFEILDKSLWTKELIVAVVSLLKKDTSDQSMVFTYIATSLERIFQKPKELKLTDKSILIGDFDLKATNLQIKIIGNIRSIDGTTTKQTIFTIKPAQLFLNKTPTYKKNGVIWNKDLERLVVNYLELLTQFTCEGNAKQIKTVVTQLKNHSEWSKKTRQLFDKLRALSPKQREDTRIVQAMRLLDDVFMTEV